MIPSLIPTHDTILEGYIDELRCGTTTDTILDTLEAYVDELCDETSISTICISFITGALILCDKEADGEEHTLCLCRRDFRYFCNRLRMRRRIGLFS